MIYSKEYFNMHLAIRRTLHPQNVEKISDEQLAHIAAPYKEELFNHYKKVVFLRWASENMENKISFSKRVEKLQKKLNIELTDGEMKKIEGIEAREFTERRALKTIEVPYKDLDNTSILLQPVAFFFYKSVRAFKKRKLFFHKLFDGEIYMTTREIVFYNREKNEIKLVIPQIDIVGITLKNEYIEIKIKDDDSIYLRHKDNEIIYISLKRSVTIRRGEGFHSEQRDEFMTTERTIESFLSINDVTDEAKIKAAKRRKKRSKIKVKKR